MTQKFVYSIGSLFAHNPEDTFIKMASLKIDFYFEVLKQLKNHVFDLPHRSNIA